MTQVKFYPLRWICNPAVIVILRMILRKDFNSCFRRITNPAERGLVSVNTVDAAIDFSLKNKLELIFNGYKNSYKALNDFGFGVAGGMIPSSSPLIPYQIQMAPSSYMLYGINYSINKTYFP